jgi:hypothetical protein
LSLGALQELQRLQDVGSGRRLFRLAALPGHDIRSACYTGTPVQEVRRGLKSSFSVEDQQAAACGCSGGAGGNIRPSSTSVSDGRTAVRLADCQRPYRGWERKPMV